MSRHTEHPLVSEQAELERHAKTSKLPAYIIILVLIASFTLALVFHPEVFAQNSVSSSTSRDDSFEPTVSKPSWVDTDNNGIADSLDQEIHEKTANGTSQDYVSVTILLRVAPTTQDANDFVSCGGYLTTSAWTEATYGFGGMTTYRGVVEFVEKCSDVLLVEKEAVGKASIAYAAQQIGARTYVWNTLGLQGDPNSAIAILDTGIDGSHVDFQPGYGDRDFSKKIVGWKDEISSTTSPVDDNGHGSHVSGLAAGDGFFSVDASGNAITTWGADLGPVPDSGTYTISGIPVNKPGTITVNVKWGHTGTGSTLSRLTLTYGDKSLVESSWPQLGAVNTPNQNQFYSLNYTVTSAPTSGYDMYHVSLTVNSGSSTSDLYITFTISWPYTPPSDGFQAWTGIAPQSKLVGVKVMNYLGEGTTNELVQGINWLIANKLTYHITVASMSLGFENEIASVDSAVVNLVNSGIAVVIAAGNDGSGSNRLFSPGSVDEAITVAAMNQFDSVTDYSSQGGTSRYTGKTVKPDITSPGGSLSGLPIFSADSNSKDAEGHFTEIQLNDSSPLQGTSMATPIISGSAQVIVQAMGGFAKWNYTRAQALQPKMILLMTATETYPNVREDNTSSASPTLERGGKDVHEGYGRVNLDAAVDAVLKSYGVGSVVTDSLGQPPTITDTSVLGQKLAWARNVQLVSGTNYNFSLNVPAGADYDLYLYNSVGTTYGEPGIVDQSTNATTGGTEQFWIKASYAGTYYIVVKRATETTGNGTFTLTSSGPNIVSVTLNTLGLQSANNVVHYTQNGVAKNGSAVANQFSADVDPSTTVTIDNPIYASATQRYVTSDPISFTVQSTATFTVNYKTQYYITATSSHDTPTASQWVDQGSSFTASVTSPTEVAAGDHQWVCTGYSIDGGTSQSGTAVTLSNVQAVHTLVFNWKEQFYLKVNSTYGSIGGDGWYDSGLTALAALSSTTISGETGVQYVFTGWSGDASGTSSTSNPILMNSPKTAVANWKTQYYLSVSSAYGGTSGAGWYDSGTAATSVLSSGRVSGGTGVQYVFSGWSGDASGTTLSAGAITMTGPKTATANWKTQYYLNVSANFGSVTPSSGWQDANSNVTISALAPSSQAGERYVLNDWTGAGSGSYTGADVQPSLTMNGPVNETASWTRQFMLTVTSAYGSPSPTTGWFDAGTSIHVSIMSPVAGSIVTQAVCTGWTGTGSVPTSGTTNTTQFTITQPSTLTWNWTTQYLLLPLLAITLIPVVFIVLLVILLLRRKQKHKPLTSAPEPISGSS